MLELDVVALEELAPGRRVVEEVAHREVGSGGRLDLGGLDVVEGGDAHLRAHIVLGAPGLERHFGDRRDRGQGLSAESVGQDLLQVFGRGDLGSRVALETEQGVVRGHAAAVVDHLDQGPARVRRDHGHGGRAGVDGILHQFLHDGSGPLHDLARRDHVGDVARQDLQRAHYSRV